MRLIRVAVGSVRMMLSVLPPRTQQLNAFASLDTLALHVKTSLNVRIRLNVRMELHVYHKPTIRSSVIAPQAIQALNVT